MSKVSSIRFSTLSSSEIRKNAVVKIVNPVSNSNSKDTIGTPYDERLGIIDNGKYCMTCNQSAIKCPGHYGYIELPEPVVNRLYIKHIINVLSVICDKCHRCILNENLGIYNGLSINVQSKHKRLVNLQKLCKKVYICQHKDCMEQRVSYSLVGKTIVKFFINKKTSINVSASDILEKFNRLDKKTVDFIGMAFRPENMIFTAFPVAPIRARPYVINNGQQCDDDLTEKYGILIKQINKYLKSSSELNRRIEMTKIQASVDSILDNRDGASQVSGGSRTHKSFFQRIAGKSGRVTDNILGKRVDFTGRSVITSGGSDLRADSLGVPRGMANIHSKPIYVREWNLEYCNRLYRDNKILRIIRTKDNERYTIRLDIVKNVDIRIGDVLERALQDGDVLVFNRQPTLRDASMIGLKIKIHDDMSLKVPLALTRQLNADFDGDECNIHASQSILAQVENEICMNSAHHIITAQRNGPVASIVQDGRVGSYILSETFSDGPTMVKSSIFYNVLDTIGISTEMIVDTLRRARRWYPEYISEMLLISDNVPGKLLLSMVFPYDMTFEKFTETNIVFNTVKIVDGIILPDSGPLCKKILGESQNSIIHLLWKDYNPQTCLKIISDIQQLVDNWFPHYGFSIGISDCLAVNNNKVSETLVKLYSDIDMIQRDNRFEVNITERVASAMNIGTRLSKDSMNKNDRNALNIMRKSGAKGSVINLSQITAFLGQQNVNGNRIPLSICRGSRTAPHFSKYDTSAESRGFVSNSYIKGILPVEMFHHASGGREGCISTALKTADSGYIQKQIARKMEDLVVRTDNSVRDPHNNIIQYIYGDDGFDAKKIYNVKGSSYPIPIDIYRLADRLNSRYRQDSISLQENSILRNLLQEEIDTILSFIKIQSIDDNETEIGRRVSINLCDTLNIALSTITVYEDNIPDLCQEIYMAIEEAKVSYGEAVGFIATCALGEPTTQMTLNVFHLAGCKGKDASGGVPRFRELLNTTKSKNQKSRSLKIHLNDPRLVDVDDGTATSILDEYKRRLLHVTIKDLVIKKTIFWKDLNSRESDGNDSHDLSDRSEDSDNSKESESRSDKSKESNNSEKESNRYQMTFPIFGNRPDTFKEEWWSLCYKEIQQLNKDDTFNVTFDISNTMWVMTMEFDKDRLYEYSVKLADIVKAISDVTDTIYCIPSPLSQCKIDVYLDVITAIKEIDVEPTRDNLVKYGYLIYRDFLDNFINNIHVKGVPGISKVFYKKIDNTEWIIETNGSNLQEVLCIPGICIKKTRSDDMWEILDIFGIDATRKFLIEELTRVLSFDGTYINPRHVSLLVDSMVNEGTLTSVRRGGISRLEKPISKIMFEEPVDNAVIASTFGECDSINTVSSAIAFGTYPLVGTGVVDVCLI